MSERVIHFWHGRHQPLVNKIAEFCEYRDGFYFWTGSIDEFITNYSGNIIVTPEYIAVTQYSNWGQR